MKFDIKLLLLILAAVIIVILLHRSCKTGTVTTTQTTTIVRVDTLKLRDTITFPKPYKIVERRTDTLRVDTGKIIADYFTEKYYQLAFRDSVIQATTDIKVVENSLELAKLDYEVYRPTIHTHTVVNEQWATRFSFSLGAGTNYNIKEKRAGLELLTTIGVKRQSIIFGYDFINQTPRLGWQYRIK